MTKSPPGLAKLMAHGRLKSGHRKKAGRLASADVRHAPLPRAPSAHLPCMLPSNEHEHEPQAAQSGPKWWGGHSSHELPTGHRGWWRSRGRAWCAGIHAASNAKASRRSHGRGDRGCRPSPVRAYSAPPGAHTARPGAPGAGPRRGRGSPACVQLCMRRLSPPWFQQGACARSLKLDMIFHGDGRKKRAACRNGSGFEKKLG